MTQEVRLPKWSYVAASMAFLIMWLHTCTSAKERAVDFYHGLYYGAKNHLFASKNYT